MNTRTTVMAGVAILATAGWALAGCAPYISGGSGNPSSGHLLGESLVTEETSYGVSAGFAHANRRVSAQYSVGHYRMSDGSSISVDCRSYSQV